jgi:UDP-N-acetylmuramoyl-L-alanyl-D-glutamate--2,6-diaminopimelate ligase
MTKDLAQLMNGFVDTHDIPPLQVAGIAYDSREVQPDFLFAALAGEKHDGHRYIPQAIARGAHAVMGSEKMQHLDVPYFQCSPIRPALATVAARFYEEPTKHVPLLGVTGTNGKTSCAFLMESILKAAGYKPALVGTIFYRYQDKIFPASHTTPESVDLQRWIAQARQEGSDSVVMEASSHGIAMDRVHACHFDGVAFTNITQDHLDFHGDIESYFKEKARLFTEILPASTKGHKGIFINWEDPYGQRLASMVSLPVIRCGWDRDLECHVLEENYQGSGIKAQLATPQGKLSIKSSLVGRFNLQNIMLAAMSCQWMEIPNGAIEEGIYAVQGVPGRLEAIVQESELQIFVDYAHTPDALRHVLEALRPLTKKRLITVFGCGGDRDTGKRPLMGHAAAHLSDVVIITSDNPRTENSEKIIDQILPGITAGKGEPYSRKNKGGFIIEEDRAEAIRIAVELAEAGDVVLIAGKGHEDYQIIGTEKHPFDDRTIAAKAYAECKKS